MTLRRYIVASLFLAPCALLTVSAQESNDEVGIWSEIGIEKAITKKWDVGLDVEYRSQDRARFSTGLGTSYKINKYLKLGVNYNFLYTGKSEKYKDKSEGEVGSEEWTLGYNRTPEYWYPRHRFSAEVTGSVKLWSWLKISLRERYQLTHRRAKTVDKFKHREEHLMHYDPTSQIKYDEDGFPVFAVDENGNFIFDENGNLVFEQEPGEPIVWEEVTVTDETEPKYIPSLTDQVLRSRIKFEFDKKRNPFSPFVSAEFHNSVSRGDHMLLQKIRAAAGLTYKFRKHNEVSLAYLVTFDMYDTEDDVVVRQHNRLHTINIGYKYSF